MFHRLRTRIRPLPWADVWAAVWVVAWAGAAEATAVTSTLATTSPTTRETQPPTTTTATTPPAARTSPAGTRVAASSLGVGPKVREGLATRAGSGKGDVTGERTTGMSCVYEIVCSQDCLRDSLPALDVSSTHARLKCPLVTNTWFQPNFTVLLSYG